MKQNLILILQFFRNPTYKTEKNKDISSTTKWFLLVLLIDLVVVQLLVPLQKLPIKLGFVNQNDHKIHQLLSNVEQEHIFLIFVLLVLIVPIIEELICRLPLIPRKKYFIPFIVFGVFVGTWSIIYSYTKTFSPITLLISVGLTILSVVFLNHKKFTRIIISNYKYFFYFMAILFALWHIPNYKFSWYVLLFSPLLTLPQLVLGLLSSLCRIKLGFIWSIMLHSLHNAFFLLPFLMFMGKANDAKLIEKIDSESYTFEVHDGYAFNKEEGIILANKTTSTSKITPNEIVLYGSLKTIVSKLAHTQQNRVEFKNEFLAEKEISLYFKNDSTSQKLKPGMAQHLVLENLLESYNLEMQKETRPVTVWELQIKNMDLFRPHISSETNTERDKSIRGFYGKRDTFKLENIDSRHLSKVLQINFNVEVKSKIDKFILFSVNVPNSNYRDLNKFMRTNYGIQISEQKIRSKFLLVK